MEFLLVHPGGPFWKNKDLGAWTIPKGEVQDGEDPLAAAKREFNEETGLKAEGTFIALTPVKQKGGKLVRAWALEADYDLSQVRSNTFTTEWPPKSGRASSFPEVDKADWLGINEARAKVNLAQVALLEETLKLAMSP